MVNKMLEYGEHKTNRTNKIDGINNMNYDHLMQTVVCLSTVIDRPSTAHILLSTLKQPELQH